MPTLRDDKMILCLEIKAPKRATAQPIKFKISISSREEIKEMLTGLLNQVDVSMLPGEHVQVQAYLVRPGGRPTAHQEFPCRADKIQSVVPLLANGLNAALAEPEKENLDTQLERGMDKIGSYVKTGFKGFMRFRAGVQAIQGSGLAGTPPNPAMMAGAVRDMVSTIGTGDGAQAGGMEGMLAQLLPMLTDPNAAANFGPEMLNGLLDSLKKDPETAQLATMVSGLISQFGAMK